MQLSDHLHKFPFLRLLLPLAAGIVVGNSLYLYGKTIPAEAALLVFVVLTLPVFIFYCLRKRDFRWVFGIYLYVFLFVAGTCWINLQLQHIDCYFPQQETVYKVIVTEKPQPKEKSLLCTVHVAEQYDSLSISYPDRKALLYFAQDSLAHFIQRGDVILISARIALPTGSGNPEEFNYPRYLLHKGVSGTAFVQSGNWQMTNEAAPFSLRATAAGYRDKVLALYRKLGFTGDEFAVLSALTVGYKDELSEEIRETFSVSGASHVLALSGLHIGLLSGFLAFFLNKIPIRRKGFMLLRAVALILLLWGFAFMAGLSSSIVRSVIMFSILSLAYFRTGKAFTLNTLAFAALCMLIYNPSWLFDVGFQLSYCAVAAILLIHPWLHKKIKSEKRVLNFFSELVSVSVSAQIGTIPLVLLYFHRFPTHFLLTNIVVIPLITLIIYLAVILLLLTPFALLQSGVAFVLNYLIKWLNAAVRHIESFPYSSFDHIWIYRLEAVGFYAILLLFAYYLATRRAKYLTAVLSLVLITTVYGTLMRLQDKPQRSLVFYNVRNCPVVHCIASGDQSWLVYADSLPEARNVTRAASGYWNRLGLSRPIPVTGSYTKAPLYHQDNFITFYNKRISIIKDNSWNYKETSTPLSVDYLYICNGYTGKLEWLTARFSAKHVLLDASLPAYRRKLLQEECLQLGITFTNLAEKASIIHC